MRLMSVDWSLFKSYRKSLIAVVLFIVYAVVLFVHNLSVQQRLEQSLLDAASLELAKRAETTFAYFSERHNTLANLATSDAVANYFFGHDLGMSIEYGLGVHIQLIEDRLGQLVEQALLGTTHIYDRIVLVDLKGELIASAGSPPPGGHDDYPALIKKLGETRSLSLLDTNDLLLFSQPVKLKGVLRAYVIAYSSVGAIANRAAAADTLSPEAVIIAASGRPLLPSASGPFSNPLVMRFLAEMPFSDTRRTTNLPDIGSDKLIAVVKQGVEGSPLALATLITERELSAYAIPSLFLIAVGAVPFIVLYIVILELRQRRRFETVLVEARLEAERLARMRSDFIANMSHEIRTPMNSVIGLTRLTLETELTARQRDYLSKAQKSALALLGMLNDILDYSKIEAGYLSIEKTSLNLQKVIAGIEDMFAIRLEEKGIAWRVDVAPDVPQELLGDPLRLSQILINLVGNAIKFTDKGEIGLKVELVSESASDVELKMSVSDTGIGLNSDQFERVFSSFTQADNTVTRKYGGTGLGLSICRHLVGLMNGKIHVESEIGVGTCFVFTIQLTKSLDVPQPLPELARNAGTTSVQNGIDVIELPANDLSHTLDFAHLASLTAELERMLGSKMLDAKVLSNTIQELIIGTKLEADFLGVRQATHELRFKAALEALPAFLLAQDRARQEHQHAT